MEAESVLDTIDSLVVSNSLNQLSEYVLDNLPLVDLPLKHGFVPGMYVREMFAAPNTLIVGQCHLTEDPYVLLKGSILVFIEGEGTVTLSGGHSGITKAGTQRAGYTLEACHWINYHVLSPEEEEARKSGICEEDLVNMIELRIYEQLDPLEDRGGKTVFEVYKDKLKEAIPCLEQ